MKISLGSRKIIDVLCKLLLQLGKNQHTRKLISAWKTSHKHNNKDQNESLIVRSTMLQTWFDFQVSATDCLQHLAMFQKEPISYTCNVDLAPFMEDRQTKTSFYASLLLTIDVVMSLALCPLVVSEKWYLNTSIFWHYYGSVWEMVSNTSIFFIQLL